jgi:hypothetical protein
MKDDIPVKAPMLGLQVDTILLRHLILATNTLYGGHEENGWLTSNILVVLRLLQGIKGRNSIYR